MKIVTMLNQKGGVGKTSTCHHLAGTLAKMGQRVLLVDNDPQSSLTQGLFGPARALSLDPGSTVAAIYRGDRPWPEQLVVESGIEGVGLVAGSESATSWNVPDPRNLGEEAQACLRDFLAEAGSLGYDLCLVDCPPNLHLCSWAALVASDALVVPMQPEDYGAQGIAAVRRSIAAVQAAMNPALRLLGYILTMVGPTKKIHKHYEEALRTAYGPLVFESKVPEAVAYVEAISNRLPIAAYKPKGQPAKAIEALAGELLSRLEADPSSLPFPATSESRVVEEVA